MQGPMEIMKRLRSLAHATRSHLKLAVVLLFLFAVFTSLARAQESPYIVIYDHYLEEPGSLEVEYFSPFGTQRGGNDFHAFWTEFEYGTTAWWTTELYLDRKSTRLN